MDTKCFRTAILWSALLSLGPGLGACDDDSGAAPATDTGPMTDSGSNGGSGADTGPTSPTDDAAPPDDAAVPDDAAASDDAGSGASFRDVMLEMTDMDPHVGQMMGFQILSEDDDSVVFRGTLASLPSAEYTYAMPSSTPAGAHRVDFFADLNMNQSYDSPPDDHAWRQSVAASDDASIEFTHNTEFTDIELPAPNGDFTFEATDMDPHVGQLFELRVIDAESGRVVGRYVLPEIQDPQFSFTLPGILEEGREYQIDYFADLSQNGEYDAPSTDHAWRRMVTADASGASVDFPHGTDFTDVGF